MPIKVEGGPDAAPERCAPTPDLAYGEAGSSGCELPEISSWGRRQDGVVARKEIPPPYDVAVSVAEVGVDMKWSSVGEMTIEPKLDHPGVVLEPTAEIFDARTDGA